MSQSKLDEIIAAVRQIGIAAGIPSTVYCAMCHEIMEILDQSQSGHELLTTLRGIADDEDGADKDRRRGAKWAGTRCFEAVESWLLLAELPSEPTGAMLALIAGEDQDPPRMTRDQALTIYRAVLALGRQAPGSVKRCNEITTCKKCGGDQRGMPCAYPEACEHPCRGYIAERNQALIQRAVVKPIYGDGPCPGGFWEPKDNGSVCKRSPEMHPAFASHKELVARLEAYFKDWAPRCRTNDPEYGAGDWRWLAEHLVAIATASTISLPSEMTDETRKRLRAAMAALVPSSDEADATRFRALPQWITAIVWKKSAADLPPLGHLKDGFNLDDLRVWCDEALEKGVPK